MIPLDPTGPLRPLMTPLPTISICFWHHKILRDVLKARMAVISTLFANTKLENNATKITIA